MAITSCKRLTPNDSLSVDAKRNKTYTHEYLVLANTNNETPGSILQGATSVGPDPLPSHWSSYNIDGFGDNDSYLQEVEVTRFQQRDDDFRHWKISCKWKPPEAGRSGPAPENPLDREVRVYLESMQFERRVTRDIVDDRLIANSAGDIYDDIKRDDARPILVAIKNEYPLQLIIARFLYFQNAVNTEEFYGAPPGCAKVQSIQCSELLTENGYPYYQVTYKIEFTTEDDSFNLVLENKGNMAYDIDKDADSNPPPTKARVKVLSGPLKGEPRDFAYLAYDGTQLADDAEPLPMPPEGEEPFRVYPQRDFAGLGIGVSL